VFADLLFLLSAAFILIGCAGVVFSKNLMHACIYLLATLFGVAGAYACIGADFLAATQLVVYAGGVVILMLFAVMLTGGGQNNTNRFGIEKVAAMGSNKTYIIAFIVVMFLSAVILKIMAGFLRIEPEKSMAWMTNTVEEIGIKLVTDHVLAFEISSVLLLGALIGAAVIARPKRS
jgi:NADH-quinone oxidoreductase subunit J